MGRVPRRKFQQGLRRVATEAAERRGQGGLRLNPGGGIGQRHVEGVLTIGTVRVRRKRTGGLRRNRPNENRLRRATPMGEEGRPAARSGPRWEERRRPAASSSKEARPRRSPGQGRRDTFPGGGTGLAR